jgi:hypothetical protein
MGLASYTGWAGTRGISTTLAMIGLVQPVDLKKLMTMMMRKKKIKKKFFSLF